MRGFKVSPRITYMLLMPHLVAQAIFFLTLVVLVVHGDGDGRRGNRPNVIVLLADNLAYDDVGIFQQQHKQKQQQPGMDNTHNMNTDTKPSHSRTPYLDKAAMEGRRLLNWNSPAVLCSASRAALLTGRYPVRTGIYPRVFAPDAAHGLLPTEVTLADQLRDLGYATKIVGKWHLGQRPEYLPTERGFDEWFGIPYHMSGGSLDDHLCTGKDPGGKNDMWLPLYEGKSIVEQPVILEHLAPRYVEESIDFIRKHVGADDNDDDNSRPFFLYLAFSHVHQLCAPKHSECQWASTHFRRDKHQPDQHQTGYNATFGDAVEEMDWIAGSVLRALEELGAENNTIVLFTSDNGPWAAEQSCAGSKGPFLGSWLAEHADPSCTACPSEYVPAPLLPGRPRRCVFPKSGSSEDGIIYEYEYEVDGVPCGEDSGLGSAWEANVRMPAFAKWPGGGIRAGSETMEMVSTLDVLPSVLGLLGVEKDEMPGNLDGVDVSDVILGRNNNNSTTSKKEDRVLFFWRDGFGSGPLPQPYGRFDVVAMKIGPIKLWFWTKSSHYNADPEVFHNPPLLFHVLEDPAEAHPLDPEAPEHVSLVARAKDLLREHKESVDWTEPLCLERDNRFLPCVDKASHCRTPITAIHDATTGTPKAPVTSNLVAGDTNRTKEERTTTTTII